MSVPGRAVKPCNILTRLAAGLVLSLSLLACSAQTVLHERVSPYRTIIVTEVGRGLRTLLFERGGARQSVVRPGDPDHIELPYARTALVGLALCEELRRVLIVGLGGGTLPGFIHRHYPRAAIDVVDIDAEVVAVAKQLFGFREDERMRVHIADGRRFIEAVRQPVYDLIILDAFGTDSIPAHLSTHEFLRSVRGAVLPQGLVVANVWGRPLNPLYDAMVRTYQEVFDDLYVVDVPGDVNKILLALPRKQAITAAELVLRARAVSTAGGFRFDLGDLVNYGFSRAGEKVRGASVLRDN
jgi:spermidine synthase